MFKIKCNHKSTGYGGSTPYVFMNGNVTDGIGRIHGDLYAKCDKCGQKFLLCNVHVDRLIRQLMDHPVSKAEVLRIVDNCKSVDTK